MGESTPNYNNLTSSKNSTSALIPYNLPLSDPALMNERSWLRTGVLTLVPEQEGWERAHLHKHLIFKEKKKKAQ